ncbi:hypothetical protein ASD00_35055 [Ensifer sp. Root31]|uniref:GrpB family protein n=1 Tax=Ensifer sp. Root31 TaxID=1736512 RepID=UPI00070FF1A8|nr:GrpB family protein [Ensifer sp. Root31]KQU81770.1 hypothetical protein ASD00_35055 [Ensifer sp. Root31]
MKLREEHWPDEATIITFEEGDPAENPWVNGRPKREEIEVERYNPMWVEQYEILEAEIKALIPEVALSVEHVGSTAVPGLPAKPVIDIDLIVPDPEREDDYVPVLEALGYELTVRERSWYQHRMLRHENPRVNLHVFGRGCAEHVRHILFRDWLREHPADKQRYADAKMLAKDGVSSAPEYNLRKQDVVREIYQNIFNNRGWQRAI